jgi:queuosine precursor transporter
MDLPHTSSHKLFSILTAVFVTALVLADIIGSKIVAFPAFSLAGIPIAPLVFSAGILPFPIAFVMTDIINEFYGEKAARFVTYIGLGVAIFCTLILSIAVTLPALETSPIPFETFKSVFGLSGRMFLASMTAYLVGQLLDIQIFFYVRKLTREKWLWLRATGSTIVSQLVDSFIVTLIAFQGVLPLSKILTIGLNNYGIKFVVALAMTPLCYLLHSMIKGLLRSESQTGRVAL